jgi:hypothetical protein
MTAPTQTAPQQTRQLSAAQTAELVALIEAQAALRQRLTNVARAAARAAFAGFTGWWDTAQVDQVIAQVLRVVQPTQQQMARVTDAFIARSASTMLGRTVSPAGAVDVTSLRRTITEAVARDLVDGRITPAYVVLGEFEPATGRVKQADSIEDPAPMAIPDPTRAQARATTTATSTSLRARAEQLRVDAKQRAAELVAARRGRAAPRQSTAATRPTTAAARPTARTGPVAAEAGTVVGPSDPYGRVADQFRYQVAAEKLTEGEARQRALVRIESVAATDITLAVREQVRKTMGKIPGITGYRRILRPELTATGPCGLCVVAADRLYHIEDLHPLHARCVCEVLPVIGAFDPGVQLNASDLAQIYTAAGSTGGGKREKGALKRIRVALAEHGELGPTLVDADQHYRSPADVARTRHPDKAVRDQAKLDAFEERLGVLLRRQGSGEQGLERAIGWQTDRIDKLRRELGGERDPRAPSVGTRPVTRRQSASV